MAGDIRVQRSGHEGDPSVLDSVEGLRIRNCFKIANFTLPVTHHRNEVGEPDTTQLIGMYSLQTVLLSRTLAGSRNLVYLLSK